MGKHLMEYKIISGRTVEIRRSWLSVRQPGESRKGRAARVAGRSSERKIKANEQSSVRELARVINSTFEPGDAQIILKYDDQHLPGSYADAEADLKRFLSKVRYELRKAGAESLVAVWVTANWSPKREAPARYHHHAVVKSETVALIRRLWTAGSFSEQDLDERGDHSALAEYMVANVNRIGAGKAKWHATRTVSRPIYTEPEPVSSVEGIQPERDSVIQEHQTATDEDGRVTSSYIRCTLKERPRVRGGKIVLPDKRRRKRKE